MMETRGSVAIRAPGGMPDAEGTIGSQGIQGIRVVTASRKAVVPGGPGRVRGSR